MKQCCPPGHGCNAPDGSESCALTLCRDAADVEGDALVALERWGAWQEACLERMRGSERRFRRRAFQRARDRALMKLALRPGGQPRAARSSEGMTRRRIRTV